MSDRMHRARTTQQHRSSRGTSVRRDTFSPHMRRVQKRKRGSLIVASVLATIFIITSIGIAARRADRSTAASPAASSVPADSVTDVSMSAPSQQPTVLPTANRPDVIPESQPADAETRPTTAVAASEQPVVFASVSAANEVPAVSTARREYGPPPPPAGGSGADFDSLIELITTTVEPDGWEDLGGPGTIQPFPTGVRADPHRLLDQVAMIDGATRLDDLATKAAPPSTAIELTGSSPLRIVSLPRLERVVADCRNAGRDVPEEVRCLAGLTSVRYVFVYPEQRDVVIAGPAELWQRDETGRAVGVDSGRPVLQLDDLVTLLRVFAPSGNGSFGCSINPRDANLKLVKEFVEASQTAGPLRPGARHGWLRELRDRMGLQDVEIYGVPRDTHVAQVIFDADYRMKLIGIGKRDAGPNVPSFFSLLRRNDGAQGVPLTALRWWMTMKCDAVLHSPARDAFEIRGSSVLVQSENQFVTDQGQHVPTGKAEPINREFAANFTQHYDDVVQRDKVFAELQNVFDLAMAAAICRREGLFETVGWAMGSFAPGGAYQVASVDTPAEIESVINHRVYGGRDIVVQVAGGVIGNVGRLLNDPARQTEARELTTPREKSTLAAPHAGRWWWDAAP